MHKIKERKDVRNRNNTYFEIKFLSHTVVIKTTVLFICLFDGEVVCAGWDLLTLLIPYSNRAHLFFG